MLDMSKEVISQANLIKNSEEVLEKMNSLRMLVTQHSLTPTDQIFDEIMRQSLVCRRFPELLAACESAGEGTDEKEMATMMHDYHKKMEDALREYPGLVEVGKMVESFWQDAEPELQLPAFVPSFCPDIDDQLDTRKCLREFAVVGPDCLSAGCCLFVACVVLLCCIFMAHALLVTTTG